MGSTDENVLGNVLSRRAVLRLGAIAGLGAPLGSLLSACSGDDSDDSAPTETVAIPALTPTPNVQPLAGLVHDDRYVLHDPGLQPLWSTGGPLPFAEPIVHPSNHLLVTNTKRLIDVSGLAERLVRIDPYPAEIEDLTVYHRPEYVERVRRLCEAGGGDAGESTPMSAESYEIGLLAAGGAMAAVDAVADGRARRVFANIRPPGHHAMATRGMGFCIFNNVVVAARHAQHKYGIERMLVLDWDVHHGNGTQDAFYRDASVLFISLHQEMLYPQNFGMLSQMGEGEGRGYTVNLPLPPGCGDAAYLAAFDEIVLPIANEFSPQLVLVSAGQDASNSDSMGRMCLTTEAYRRMTQAAIDLAEEHADGRLVLLLEGGYSDLYAPYCSLAIVETLAETRTGLAEPSTIEYLANEPQYHTVGLSAAARIDEIRATYAPYWASLR